MPRKKKEAIVPSADPAEAEAPPADSAGMEALPADPAEAEAGRTEAAGRKRSGAASGRRRKAGASADGLSPRKTSVPAVFRDLPEADFGGPDWKKIQKALMKGEIVPCTIVGLADGVVYAEVLGAQAVMPVSEFDWLESHGRVEGFFGSRTYCVIKGIDPEAGLLAVSRREAAERLARSFLRRHKPGDLAEGVVVGVGKAAVFVDFGGVIGTASIWEISHTWVKDLRAMIRKGVRVRAVLKSLDPERRRADISIKEALEDPWEKFSRYARPGMLVSGTVEGFLPERRLVFVRLGNGIIGAAIYPEHLDLEEGDPVRCRIRKLDGERRRVWLFIQSRALVQPARPTG